MSLEIGSALSSGIEKLTTTAGLLLAAAYAALQLVSVGASNALLVDMLPASATAEMNFAFVFPVSTPVASALTVLVMVASVVLTVVVLRTVAHDASDLDSIPGDAFDRLGVTAVFLFVSNLVVGVAVAIGFVLLVLPGIFLAASMAFTQVYVAVEGEGPFEAMDSSWSLASGDRFALLLLGLAIVGIGIVIGLVTGAVSLASPLAGTLAQTVISAGMFVFGNAVLVDAFRQLRTAEEETVGALTAEELASNQNR